MILSLSEIIFVSIIRWTIGKRMDFNERSLRFIFIITIMLKYIHTCLLQIMQIQLQDINIHMILNTLNIHILEYISSKLVIISLHIFLINHSICIFNQLWYYRRNTHTHLMYAPSIRKNLTKEKEIRKIWTHQNYLSQSEWNRGG